MAIFAHATLRVISSTTKRKTGEKHFSSRSEGTVKCSRTSCIDASINMQLRIDASCHRSWGSKFDTRRETRQDLRPLGLAQRRVGIGQRQDQARRWPIASVGDLADLDYLNVLLLLFILFFQPQYARRVLIVTSY